jgi:hypothetical protein
MGFVEVTNKIYGKPLIILSKFYFGGPPFMDTPLFALYENGQIIFRKERKNKRIRCLEIILTKEEIEQFLQSLPFDEIYKIKGQDINVSGGWTDMPTTILELNIKEYKKVRVNGVITDKKVRKFIPNNYLKIYDFLINYCNEKSYEWYPDSICVKFCKPFPVKKYKEWSSELPKIDFDSPKDDRDNICLLLQKHYVKIYLEYFKNYSQFSEIKYENNFLTMFYNIKFPNINYIDSMCDDTMFDENM